MKLFFLLFLLIPASAWAVTIVSDPYPNNVIQPTHCRLDFATPSGEPARTTPVEVLADNTVRCAWPINDLLVPGQALDLVVTARAINQATGQESAETSPFSLSASGSPMSPAALQLDYN